jgi:hypothetical protein
MTQTNTGRIHEKIRALHYNGTERELHDQLRESFIQGFKARDVGMLLLIDDILADLPTERYDEILQIVGCMIPPDQVGKDLGKW